MSGISGIDDSIGSSINIYNKKPRISHIMAVDYQQSGTGVVRSKFQSTKLIGNYANHLNIKTQRSTLSGNNLSKYVLTNNSKKSHNNVF